MSREAICHDVGHTKLIRARESSQPLLTPHRMGDLDLPNRVVMDPLTRMRAKPDDHVPTILQAEHYAQRDSAGLTIAEATAISPGGFGWGDTRGLWSEEQIRGWRRVTDAVHLADGRIIGQLWHTGAISHPELRNGLQPVSASDVNPLQVSVTRSGRKPTVAPRPLTKREIQAMVADFGWAARNALVAGFDGVDIPANYLYLIAQFLNAPTNLRIDEYGGSLENRSRFLSKVEERGNRLVAEGLADLLAFGRPYIANFDLVQRFTDGALLAEVHWETVYASVPRGYSDYPTYEPSHVTRS